MIEELINIGLTKNEARAYIYLLNDKGQTATAISKSLGINRSVVYSILYSLIDKGLVSNFLINGINHFKSNKPSSLKSFLEYKKEILHSILHKLNKVYPVFQTPAKVEIFQGINGGITVLKDIVKTGKDYIAFGEDNDFQKIFGTLAEQYIRQLNEKKIHERLITTEGNKFLRSKYTKVKYIPKNFSLPSITVIYGNKVAIAIFKKPYIVVLIESEDVAKTYKNIFENLWKITKKSLKTLSP